MTLEPGMRVRCVGNKYREDILRKGQEYTIERYASGFVWLREVIHSRGFSQLRFKPVVRVKMGRAVA